MFDQFFVGYQLVASWQKLLNFKAVSKRMNCLPLPSLSRSVDSSFQFALKLSSVINKMIAFNFFVMILVVISGASAENEDIVDEIVLFLSDSLNQQITDSDALLASLTKFDLNIKDTLFGLEKILADWIGTFGPLGILLKASMTVVLEVQGELSDGITQLYIAVQEALIKISHFLVTNVSDMIVSIKFFATHPDFSSNKEQIKEIVSEFSSCFGSVFSQALIDCKSYYVKCTAAIEDGNLGVNLIIQNPVQLGVADAVSFVKYLLKFF